MSSNTLISPACVGVFAMLGKTEVLVYRYALILPKIIPNMFEIYIYEIYLFATKCDFFIYINYFCALLSVETSYTVPNLFSQFFINTIFIQPTT